MARFGINAVTVSGNIVRDIELRATAGGTEVANFSIAWNESRKGPDGNYTDVAHYFDVVVFGGVGRWLSQNVAKGSPIVVSGVLQQDRWTTEQGDNRSKVKILANNVQPMRGEAAAGTQSQQPEQQATQAPAPVAAPATPVDDGQIPF